MLPALKYPSVTQYAESVGSPYGLFRTLGEPECLRDAYGLQMCAGGNSAVFRVLVEGVEYALKCYTNPHRSVAQVCGYFLSHPVPLLYPVSFLPEEIFVYDDSSEGGKWYDAVLMPWSQGDTLESVIACAADAADPVRLRSLAESFDEMALELLEAPWAHGDLKPENIMVEGGRMRLVDYDAVYVPGLEPPEESECGTPKYRHPKRPGEAPGLWIDDYPVALISVSLHALALCPKLYERYNTTDNIIFDPEEIVDGRSEAYCEALDMFAGAGLGQLYSLALLLESRHPYLPALESKLKAVVRGCDCTANGELFLFESGGLWGYADAAGRERIPARYRSALEFSEGLAAVNLGGYNHFIDTGGGTVMRMDAYESIKSFSYALAAVKRGGMWGYVSRCGKEVLSPTYCRASSVRDGRARVWEQSGKVREFEVYEGGIIRFCQP